MFGFGKKKTLNIDLIPANYAELIIDLWTDTNSLDFNKFIDEIFFLSNISDDNLEADNFLVEKIRFITGCVLISIKKNEILKSSMKPLFLEIEKRIDRLGKTDIAKRAKEDLHGYALSYADIFLNNSPKDAGQIIEETFSKRVFNAIPSNDDIDAKYLLYKQLSKLQRSVIFRLMDADRKSYVVSK